MTKRRHFFATMSGTVVEGSEQFMKSSIRDAVGRPDTFGGLVQWDGVLDIQIDGPEEPPKDAKQS